jgi:esterase/lipase superfamily enzyme
MLFFLLDFRSGDVGGSVVPGRLTLGAPTIDDLRACANVVFMVHGFNVDRATGAAELQALSTLLPAVGEGAAVAVLWPGDSSIGPASYPFETNKADDTAVELAKFIGDNLPQHPAISFAAHSLGSRVVMQTVQQLKIKGVPVNQVCLMAGAIDNNSLAGTALYRGASEYAARVAVLYSPSDTVLKYAYPAGNILSAFLHWNATSDAALGYTGPKPASGADATIPAPVASTGIPTGDGVNHSDYIPSANVPPSAKQLAAARYANLVLSGALPLSYL